MKSLRVGFNWAMLTLVPGTALAQSGVTPLLTDPVAMSGNAWRISGYITIEDDIDLFAVYRQAIGSGFDVGARAGFTDVRGGGVHLGGDLRYGIAAGQDVGVEFALAGGVQLTFADRANLIAIPFGVSIGADIGTGDRAIVLYGLPFLEMVRLDPDAGASDTSLEFGAELGANIEIAPRLDFSGALVVASHDDDNISLALGLTFK